MAFGGFESGKHAGPMAEINVTPMVDVMLVLLVIFIITAPLFTHAIKLDLPKAQAAPAPPQGPAITISIDAAGRLYWDDVPVTREDLAARMAAQAQRDPQPDVLLRAGRSTPFEQVTDVMAAAQSAGLGRIGFVTAPKNHP
jgi:biopolymer transport protein ExbD